MSHSKLKRRHISSPLSFLPEDLILLIWLFDPHVIFTSAVHVCKTWSELVRQEKSLWPTTSCLTTSYDLHESPKRLAFLRQLWNDTATQMSLQRAGFECCTALNWYIDCNHLSPRADSQFNLVLTTCLQSMLHLREISLSMAPRMLSFDSILKLPCLQKLYLSLVAGTRIECTLPVEFRMQTLTDLKICSRSDVQMPDALLLITPQLTSLHLSNSHAAVGQSVSQLEQLRQLTLHLTIPPEHLDPSSALAALEHCARNPAIKHFQLQLFGFEYVARFEEESAQFTHAFSRFHSHLEILHLRLNHMSLNYDMPYATVEDDNDVRSFDLDLLECIAECGALKQLHLESAARDNHWRNPPVLSEEALSLLFPLAASGLQALYLHGVMISSITLIYLVQAFPQLRALEATVAAPIYPKELFSLFVQIHLHSTLDFCYLKYAYWYQKSHLDYTHLVAQLQHLKPTPAHSIFFHGGAVGFVNLNDRDEQKLHVASSTTLKTVKSLIQYTSND